MGYEPRHRHKEAIENDFGGQEFHHFQQIWSIAGGVYSPVRS